jgi:hypothetical protein
MHKQGIAATFGLGALVLGLGTASAQDTQCTDQTGASESCLEYKPTFDPEQFTGSADPDQIGLIDGARTQTMGTISAGVVFHFAGPPLDISVRNRGCTGEDCQTVSGDIINARLRADLGILYGFGRFDARLTLPFVLNQSSDFDPQMGQPQLGSQGVGDPKVGLRFQIARPGNLDIAADLGVSIPTGGEDFIGDAGLVIDPRLLFDFRKGKVAAGLNLGYRFRQDSAEVANLYVDDEITWSAALQYWISEKKFAIGAAAYGKIGFMNAPTEAMEIPGIVKDIGSEEYPAEVLGSLRYFVTDKIALDVGGGTALSQGYGATPFRVLAGVRWINQKTEVVRS